MTLPYGNSPHYSRLTRRISLSLSVCVLMLSTSFALLGQGTGGTGGGAGGSTGGGNTGGTGGGAGGGNTGGTGGGFPGGGTTGRPGTGFPTPGQTGQPGQNDPFGRTQDPFGNRPIYLSGKVVLSDGGPAPIETVIERVCNGQPIPEGYVNTKGEFNIQLGRNSQLFSDASTSSWGGADPFGRGNSGGIAGPGGSAINERDLIGCEIRATLPGYRSNIVQLAGRRMLDNPDVGTIVLTRLAKVEGFTISATTLNAPKDAKKSYDKGVSELRKDKAEKSLAHFDKAIALHPTYAVAWYERGRALESLKKFDEAIASYDKAIESDSKYLSPYLRLASIAAMNNDWEKTEQYSATAIRMNPVDFPYAYYLNALSNLQLQNFTKAEESATEAQKMDPGNRMTRLDYFLALILANQRKYEDAAGHMKTFIGTLPEGTDPTTYQKQLSEIEQLALAEKTPDRAP